MHEQTTAMALGRTNTVKSRARRPVAESGFTLVELAVVVTIVGILSVIAVVGYRRYVTTSKINEAHAMIGAIRIAQEAHKSERGRYADLGTTFCPTTLGSGSIKTGWNPACSGGTSTWQTLPVHSDGPVIFSYATWAGNGTFTAGPATWVTWPDTVTGPWYIVMAKADLDGNTSDYTELVGSSFQNTVFSRNDGL